MGKAAREQLNRALSEHLNTIHETFQMLDRAPASSLEKVSWKEVIQMSEQVSKQATTGLSLNSPVSSFFLSLSIVILTFVCLILSKKLYLVDYYGNLGE